MAFTATKAQVTVHGNQRCWQGVITADGTSDTVDVGFDTILHVQATPKSATAYSGSFQANVLTAATASPGTLAVTGVTSGDDYYVTIWGR